MEKILNKFTKHPKEQNETYFKHFEEAIKISFEAAQISTIALIHAFLPCFFETTASQRICLLNQRIEKRRNKNNEKKCSSISCPR